MSTASTHQCVICQQPTATACALCIDTPPYLTPQSPIYICSSATCSTAHGALCTTLQKRRALYRAGATLQAIFYDFRAQLFEIPVLRTERRGDKLLVWIKAFEPLQIDHDLIRGVPEGVVRDGEDRLALLSFARSLDAVAFMHELVKYFLKDLTTDILEVCYLPPRTLPLQILLFGPNDQDIGLIPPHHLLKLTLGHETYALDLAGAQYGFPAPIIPWATYLQTRCSSERGAIATGHFLYFGSARDRKVVIRLQDTWEAVLADMHLEAAKQMRDMMIHWEARTGVGISEVLGGSGRVEFEWREGELRGVLRGAVRFWVDWHAERAREALMVDP